MGSEQRETTTSLGSKQMRLLQRKSSKHGNVESGEEQEKLERGEGGNLTQDDNVLITRGIQRDGRSERNWFNLWHFIRICWYSSSHVSMCTNLLWPFTIAAIVLHFRYGDQCPLWVFITSYIGMVAPGNTLGFAGHEMARKIPTVAGVILQTTVGSIVEIILFMVLITERSGNVPVIQAAILGSILANMLLCLGMCFFVGGIYYPQQNFDGAISEVGSNLMLVAGVGLIVPTIYYNSLFGGNRITVERLNVNTLHVSYGAAVVLLVAYLLYVWFQSRSHHSLYEAILTADKEREHNQQHNLAKTRLTITEALISMAICITCVILMAVFLVQQIDYIVHRGVSHQFIGLILLPLVEKASEHLTTVNRAYDNQMNSALAHILGASIQTALFNAPLVVIVGWGLHSDMTVNFELFDAVTLILAIIIVGNFLRSEKSNYLEGALCVIVYMLIAVAAFFYPDPPH